MHGDRTHLHQPTPNAAESNATPQVHANHPKATTADVSATGGASGTTTHHGKRGRTCIHPRLCTKLTRGNTFLLVPCYELCMPSTIRQGAFKIGFRCAAEYLQRDLRLGKGGVDNGISTIQLQEYWDRAVENLRGT